MYKIYIYIYIYINLYVYIYIALGFRGQVLPKRRHGRPRKPRVCAGRTGRGRRRASKSVCVGERGRRVDIAARQGAVADIHDRFIYIYIYIYIYILMYIYIYIYIDI